MAECVWDPEQHTEGETPTPEAGIIFGLKALFQRRVRGRAVWADRGHGLPVNRTDLPRNTYPRGLVQTLGIGISPRIAQELHVLSGGSRRFDGENPFSDVTVAMSGRLHALAHAAVLHARQTPRDPLLLEEAWFELVLGLAGSFGPDRPSHRSPAPGPYFRRAQIFIHDHVQDRIRLRDVAASAGCSTWHLTEVFNRSCGVSVYRYVRRTRLRAALSMLDDAGTTLAEIALETGFNSQSHLTTAFRGEFGSTPGRWRSYTSTERLRMMLALRNGERPSSQDPCRHRLRPRLPRRPGVPPSTLTDSAP